MTKSNEAALNAALDAHFARKEARQPYYGTDPEEWRIELRRNGEDLSYFIVDEYGEEVRGGGCWANPGNAEARLKEMIAEEIEAREQHGPDSDPMDGVEFPFAENH